MKAFVKSARAYGHVEMQEAPRPQAGPGQVLIRVKAAAICGSDLHAYEYPPGYEFMKIPVTLGHEYSGVVEAVGAGVTRFAAGDRVMGESNRYCGHCANCRRGLTNICAHNRMTGLEIDGGMAEYIAAPQGIVHRIPDGVSFAAAAVAQPCAVSFHGIFDHSSIAPADVALVFGPGIVGLMAAQAARIMGARKVVVAGADADAAVRLPLAAKMGFDVVNVQKQDLPQALRALTGGAEVDVAVEASGAAAAVRQAAGVVRKGGSITLIGIYAKPVEMSFTRLIRNEIQLHTSYTCTWKNYEQALQLIASGQVDLEPLLATYPFASGQAAIDDALAKKVLKPVLLL